MSVSPATNPTISLGTKSLVISWTNSISAGATHTIYRSRQACGTYVPVASGILSPYIDYNVSNGEVYNYYIVANVANNASDASSTVSLQFIGSSDQYKDSLTSQDARSEVIGATVVYSGSVASGCGEYQRLQQLRGKFFLCGK
jgi:hypothetical protein